jgi:2,5-diketo-D-gluconate reductase A
VSSALEAGYRHIDTAEMYRNEAEVGAAIRKSGLDRADLFVTTKLNNGEHRPDDARVAFDKSLTALGFDYVDLFLIHWPLPTRYGGDFVSTWQTLEEFYRDGRARSIGVSNFQPHHLRRIHQECEITPAVDQIEVNPYLTQDDVREFCAEHQIAIEAWSPLARGNALDDPTVDDIARRYGKTPAQVILRWHIERGDIVFPKSVTPARIRENFDIFDFELTGEDVEAITALNRNQRTGPDPDKFDGGLPD